MYAEAALKYHGEYARFGNVVPTSGATEVAVPPGRRVRKSALGIAGVYRDTNGRKYRAQLWVNGKDKILGYYATPIAAWYALRDANNTYGKPLSTRQKPMCATSPTSRCLAAQPSNNSCLWSPHQQQYLPKAWTMRTYECRRCNSKVQRLNSHGRAPWFCQELRTGYLCRAHPSPQCAGSHQATSGTQ